MSADVVQPRYLLPMMLMFAGVEPAAPRASVGSG